jgi:ribosomal-protein-alanine N-acetyltransferase
MGLGDLDEVIALERLAFKNPWSMELFRRELDHAWSTILVAETSSASKPAVVGFIIFWLVQDEIHILNIASDPARLRQGIARALLAECLARGKEAGACLATLEVRRSNTAAIELYQSIGFRPVGVRPNYYSDEGEDGIVMTLDFP